jgi:hypothetical protein
MSAAGPARPGGRHPGYALAAAARPAALAARRGWLRLRSWATALPAQCLPTGCAPRLPPWALTVTGAAVLVAAAAAAGVLLLLLHGGRLPGRRAGQSTAAIPHRYG